MDPKPSLLPAVTFTLVTCVCFIVIKYTNELWQEVFKSVCDFNLKFLPEAELYE